MRVEAGPIFDDSAEDGITSTTHWAAQELRALSLTCPEPEPHPHAALRIHNRLIDLGAEEGQMDPRMIVIDPPPPVLPEITLVQQGKEMTMTFSDFSMVEKIFGGQRRSADDAKEPVDR